MVKATLDIDSIQHINLFERFTAVRASLCFSYGGALIFVVKPELMAKVMSKISIMRKLSKILKRRIRIVAAPKNSTFTELEKFAKAVVWPIKFKKLTLNNNELTITANMQARASLIGRDKSRLLQLQDILKKYFEISQIKISSS